MLHDRRWLILTPVALIVMGVVIASIRAPLSPSTSSNSAEDSPQACIGGLLAAEEQGDSRAYLDCFTHVEQTRLESTWRGQSPSQISSDLRHHCDGVVGHATSDVVLNGTDRAELTLERIRRDDVELHDVSLIKDAGRWRISALSQPRRKTPAIPYGTPVAH